MESKLPKVIKAVEEFQGEILTRRELNTLITKATDGSCSFATLSYYRQALVNLDIVITNDDWTYKKVKK